MRKTVPLGLTLLLILTLILSSCGNAGKASPDPAATNSGEQHKTAEDSATKEPGTKETTAEENATDEATTEETTTEEETTKAPENFLEALFDVSPEKGALAEVLTKKVDEYGKPWFTNENISKVKGIGLTYMIDLDDDGTDELILVHWEDSEPYGGYVMEIYGGPGANLIYSGTPYRMGADNVGLWILKDPSGQKVLVYDNEDTMNGHNLGVLKNGRLEVIHEMDWEKDTYEFPEDAFVLNGVRYEEVAEYGMYCYNYQEMDDTYLFWKDSFKLAYRDTLSELGLSKEDGAAYYTPGILSLLDNKYKLIKETQVDASGTISAVYEHEYNDQGKEIRAYKNDMLHREKEYSPKGVLLHEVQYNTTPWYKSKEDIYDEKGNLLESITYSENGNTNWDIIYTYDEEGKKLTEDSGIAFKEYDYNEEGVMTEVRSYGNKGGEVDVRHIFTLDEQGRQIEDTIIKKDTPLKCTTWEYYEDGTYQETSWLYQQYDADVNMVLIPGEEKPGVITLYDADDKVLHEEVWVFDDFGSKETVLSSVIDNEYDSEGNLIRKDSCTYNKGVLSYEEVITYERNAEGSVVKQENYYHNYGYWTNLGETESELTYTAYAYDFNDQGYKVHGVAMTNDDPYSGQETYLKYENYLLYQNAFGDLMGMDY